MDPQINEYIRQNRDRYTPEAMRQQLIAAGHEPAAIDAALDRANASSAASVRPAGWRPGWREFLVLLVVGAIGAAIIWADEPYGAGTIAPVAYAVIIAIGFGLAKLLSVLIDGGNAGVASVVLGIVAVGGVYLSVINGLSPIALALTVMTAALAVVLFVIGRRNQRISGMVGASLPILVWLVVTGTCYAPLFT